MPRHILRDSALSIGALLIALASLFLVHLFPILKLPHMIYLVTAIFLVFFMSVFESMLKDVESAEFPTTHPQGAKLKNLVLKLKNTKVMSWLYRMHTSKINKPYSRSNAISTTCLFIWYVLKFSGIDPVISAPFIFSGLIFSIIDLYFILKPLTKVEMYSIYTLLPEEYDQLLQYEAKDFPDLDSHEYSKFEFLYKLYQKTPNFARIEGIDAYYNTQTNINATNG